MKTIVAVITSAILCIAAPVWAVNKCVGPGGAVVFQDAPCDGKGETLTVRPAAGSGASASVPEGTGTAAKPTTEAQRIERQIAESQVERRLRDLTTRLVPQADQAVINNLKSCEQEQARIKSDQYAYVQNLYGKTHAAQRASELAASASRCDMKDRELRADAEALRAECRELGGCK